MTVLVVWSSRARRELMETCRWYDNQGMERGDIFVEKVHEAVDLVQRHIRIGPPLDARYRQVVLDGFPYRLIYRVTKVGIQIASVWPDRRDPKGLPGSGKRGD